MIEETKQKIDKLVQQKRNIESQLTTLQQEYHRLLCKNIQVGTIYNLYENEYLKVLKTYSDKANVLYITEDTITQDEWDLGTLVKLRTTTLSSEIKQIWKDRGVII